MWLVNTLELYYQRWLQVCLGLTAAKKMTGGVARLWYLSKLSSCFTQTWTAYQVCLDHFFFLSTSGLMQREYHICTLP